jgi:hypothetical protein
VESSDTTSQLSIRIPSGLRHRFFRRCRVDQRRSMNEVVLELIEAYLSTTTEPDPDEEL